jgi:hypothetical protein
MALQETSAPQKCSPPPSWPLGQGGSPGPFSRFQVGRERAQRPENPPDISSAVVAGGCRLGQGRLRHLAVDLNHLWSSWGVSSLPAPEAVQVQPAGTCRTVPTSILAVILAELPSGMTGHQEPLLRRTEGRADGFRASRDGTRGVALVGSVSVMTGESCLLVWGGTLPPQVGGKQSALSFDRRCRYRPEWVRASRPRAR